MHACALELTSLSLAGNANTRARTHARTRSRTHEHARTHARTHARARTHACTSTHAERGFKSTAATGFEAPGVRYIVMACVAMACVVMACVGMAYVVMALPTGLEALGVRVACASSMASAKVSPVDVAAQAIASRRAIERLGGPGATHTHTHPCARACDAGAARSVLVQ